MSGDNGFFPKNSNNTEESPPAQQQQPSFPQPPPQIMWPPPQFMQPPPPPTQAQHPHPQPQQFNELFYNMRAQAFATATPGQPETYSVLPVGHGNFLKVYHRAETAPQASAGSAEATILYQQQQFQQQQQYHPTTHQQQQQQQQQIYNSYELFSSNTLMPENTVTTATMPEIPMIPLPPQLHMQGNNSTELHSSNSGASNNNTTNMIINKLVNNWSPNLTGGTYAQFGQVNSSALAPNVSNNNNSHIEPIYPIQQPQIPVALATDVNFQDASSSNAIFNTNMTQLPMQSTFLPQQNQTTPNVTSNAAALNQPQLQSNATLPADSIVPEVFSNNTNGALDTTGRTTIKDQAKVNAPTVISTSLSSTGVQLDGNKKRIVAEVKPMRMTYSDVLSKFNNQHVTPIQSATNSKTNTNKSTKQIFNDRKTETKRSSDANINSTSSRQSPVEDVQAKANKKSSPIHENKENISQSTTNSVKSSNNKRFINGTNSNNPNNKNTQKATQKSNASESFVAGAASNGSKKRGVQKRTDGDFNSDSSSTGRYNNKSNPNTNSSSTDKDFNGFYNVTAKNNDNYDRPTKSSSQLNSSNVYRRSAKSTSSASHNNAASTSSQNFSRNVQRSGHSSNGGSTLSSFSFSSTKRGRGANSSLANQGSRNYELAKMFLHKWFEYTLMILTWLFYLVYDIVVLGFSMVYDRLTHYSACVFAYAQQLRKDLKQNSNKPSLWIRNYWRRFDGKFKKNSKWAVWRRFYKKKHTEATTDFYKNGRLPQTGEEAMFSLLNCKGKDAYSILGVPSNSSQEQIRKHYKKIAVLVHPDKNKQAGAEEAFKVLQRAFELIGEPENREAYDRSLDEALHAEKAWTELHDLLSQLQTKITEAANTIRCSTCGLRHPRKLTDRPHYAARECASCKIRHSAREGDIWAETTMLGLRWKYLALMEGKVYDITEWANCQKGALSHLEPNSHMVQYRIVRGAQQQQQQQQNPQAHQQYQQQPHTSNHSHQQYHHPHAQSGGSSKYKRDIPPNEATLHEFLDNLYSRQHPNGQPNSTVFSGSARKRARRN